MKSVKECNKLVLRTCNVENDDFIVWVAVPTFSQVLICKCKNKHKHICFLTSATLIKPHELHLILTLVLVAVLCREIVLRSTGAALTLAFLNFGYLLLILLHVITLYLLEPLLIDFM